MHTHLAHAPPGNQVQYLERKGKIPKLTIGAGLPQLHRSHRWVQLFLRVTRVRYVAKAVTPARYVAPAATHVRYLALRETTSDCTAQTWARASHPRRV